MCFVLEKNMILEVVWMVDWNKQIMKLENQLEIYCEGLVVDDMSFF